MGDKTLSDEAILSMARRAGWNTEHVATNDYLIRFARVLAVTQKEWMGQTDDQAVQEAVAKEREECAKLCDSLAEAGATKYKKIRQQCAAHIRKRDLNDDRPSHPVVSSEFRNEL